MFILCIYCILEVYVIIIYDYIMYTYSHADGVMTSSLIRPSTSSEDRQPDRSPMSFTRFFVENNKTYKNWYFLFLLIIIIIRSRVRVYGGGGGGGCTTHVLATIRIVYTWTTVSRSWWYYNNIILCSLWHCSGRRNDNILTTSAGMRDRRESEGTAAGSSGRNEISSSARIIIEKKYRADEYNNIHT